MTNPYPASITDANSETRVAGQIDFTDPGNQPGGTAPITREELGGLGVVIANTDADRLTWDSSNGPDTLLDITTPNIPTIIDAGVYVFAVNCIPASNMALGGWYEMQLKLDGAGFNASTYAASPRANGISGGGYSGGQPEVTLTMAWYMPAGARVEVWITNNDGSGPIGYALNNAHVQRLS